MPLLRLTFPELRTFGDKVVNASPKLICCLLSISASLVPISLSSNNPDLHKSQSLSSCEHKTVLFTCWRNVKSAIPDRIELTHKLPSTVKPDSTPAMVKFD